ncbi:MAG: hypothetical protein KAQ87_03590 [Candidatus Pacebacteria bacterium]|nr:hypothetical protein [Candidatus Paceibacterota bacterium]
MNFFAKRFLSIPFFWERLERRDWSTERTVSGEYLENLEHSSVGSHPTRAGAFEL